MDFINIYSSFIQISGIFIALVSIIALYRIEQIKTYLVGLGANVHKREMGKKEKTIGQLYLDRLQGAVDIKNVEGIEEIIIRLTIEECRMFPEKKDRGKTGYWRQAWPYWKDTIQLLKSIHQFFIKSMVFVLLILIFSLFAIGLNSFVNCFINYVFFSLITLFIIISLFFICKVINKSFFTKLRYEVQKFEESMELRKGHPEIDELYIREVDEIT